MAYTVPTWVDSPSTSTALSAANLNQGSTAIRDIDIRLSQIVVNVKTDYGATGNGSTDDTTAIQNALNAVPVGGGVVYLPAGRYKVSSMLQAPTSGTVLRGALPGHPANDFHNIAGTRIEAFGTLSGNPIVRFQETADTNPLFGCMLADLIIDGMGTATGPGVHWRSYESRIDRVNIFRCGTNGLWVNGYPGWDLYDTVITRVISSNNGGSGVYLDTGATDLLIADCVVHNNNINLEVRNGSSIQMTACHFYDATLDNIRINGGGSRSKFVGLKIEGAGAHGVNMDSTNGGPSEMQFVGCNFANNSKTTTNAADHFIIQGTSANGIYKTMLAACTFTQYGGQVNKARYAVNLSTAASQSTMITGCNFGESANYGTGVLNDASSGSFPLIQSANGGTSFVTRTSGTATVASGTTSVNVTHGITGITPSAGHVKVVPTNNMGSATKFWVSAVGGTTFTINTDVNPGATTATFAWQVNV